MSCVITDTCARNVETDRQTSDDAQRDRTGIDCTDVQRSGLESFCQKQDSTADNNIQVFNTSTESDLTEKNNPGKKVFP